MGCLQTKLRRQDRSDVIDLWLRKMPYSRRKYDLYYFETQLVKFCGNRADFDMIIFYPPDYLWATDGANFKFPEKVKLRIVLRNRYMREKDLVQLYDANYRYCLDRREYNEDEQHLAFPRPPRNYKSDEGFYWSSKLYPAHR